MAIYLIDLETRMKYWSRKDKQKRSNRTIERMIHSSLPKQQQSAKSRVQSGFPSRQSDGTKGKSNETKNG